MKFTIKKFIAIFAIILFIVNAINIKSFANIEKRDLYSKGTCGRLLKKGDMVVKTSIVVYKKDGKEYPAYCLDKTKQGVDEEISYSVDLDGVIKNVHIWKAITNGYPYKTPKEMGCNTVGEAFMATKMAVYSVLYNYKISDFSPIGKAGERTWNALRNILEKVNDGNDTQISSNINITEDKTEWESAENLEGYIFKTYKVSSDAPMDTYKVTLEQKTEGTKILDLNNNEKNEFNRNEKFKIAVPINELSDGGKIKIKAEANVETKPIFIGRAPNSKNQDYAITGISYEEGEGYEETSYGKNETRIKIIKLDEDGETRLKNAVFCLMDKNKKVVISEIKTDENGEAIIDNILPGKYYINEINAPAGYIKYDKEIEINTKFNEELTITIKNKKEEEPEIDIKKREIELKTELKKLPKTGM